MKPIKFEQSQLRKLATATEERVQRREGNKKTDAKVLMEHCRKKSTRVRDPVSRSYQCSGFADPLSSRNALSVCELKAGMVH